VVINSHNDLVQMCLTVDEGRMKQPERFIEIFDETMEEVMH
jgi:hypothetical protein